MRVLSGNATLSSKIAAGGTTSFIIEGPAQFASTGKSVIFAADFGNATYPYEKVAFNGADISYGLPSGKTTLLGAYVRAQNSVLKDGLFGGVLSTAWPLLDIKSSSKIKLETAGTAKVEGITCYKVKYSSSRTGEMRVTLYFEAKTLRHIRTEYQYTIEPRIGTSPTDTQSSSRVERYTLVEDFSNFAEAGALTLPMTYKITITTERQATAGTNVREWITKFDKVFYDQKLGPEIFKVS